MPDKNNDVPQTQQAIYTYIQSLIDSIQTTAVDSGSSEKGKQTMEPESHPSTEENLGNHRSNAEPGPKEKTKDTNKQKEPLPLSPGLNEQGLPMSITLFPKPS